LSYQAGVRGEDSRLDATFTSYNMSNVLFAAPVKVPVKGLYPSLLLTEKLKNNRQLQLTFTSRISKPSVRQLNSTIDFSDPSNFNKGNGTERKPACAKLSRARRPPHWPIMQPASITSIVDFPTRVSVRFCVRANWIPT